MKVTVQNPTQSQKRINFLSIAGVKPKRVIITPQNEKRISSGYGEVLYNYKTTNLVNERLYYNSKSYKNPKKNKLA